MKLKIIGIGIVLGMLLGTIYFCHVSEKATAEIVEEIKIAQAKAEYKPHATKIVYEVQDVATEEPEAHAPFEMIPLDSEYQIYLENRCKEKGLNIYLVLALMESESHFDTDAEGDSGRSVGLMQINKVWWDVMKEAGVDVFDVYGNIEAGLLILQEYQTKGYTDEEAIQFYKCGETRGKELLNEGVILPQVLEVIAESEKLEGILK